MQKTSVGSQHQSLFCQGKKKDIVVFRFIIESSSSLRDFYGPQLGNNNNNNNNNNRSIYFYMRIFETIIFWLQVLKLLRLVIIEL
jgi:hypothetical protein